ncbi:MAG: hypothetical protein DRG83_12500 [Deltaproteobacteria bacterium]|nr:MAG: hypothetical protein DRG83_12500 [Deltaproteobacteria bacterium]
MKHKELFDKIARKYLPKRSPNKGILALVTMGLNQNHYLIPYPTMQRQKLLLKRNLHGFIRLLNLQPHCILLE